MKIIYTTDEVLSNFQEILEAIFAGERITVTDQDVPVAEICPLPEERRKPYIAGTGSLDQHMEEMRRRGVLGPPVGPRKEFNATEHLPGALERFLAERE